MDLVSHLLLNFLLILGRISTFFIVSPIFSMRGVPNVFKIGLVLFLSFITFGTIGLHVENTLSGIFILALIQEILVGLTLGFAAYLLFSAVQVAGSFVDLQMGFGIANVVDPITGAQSPMLGNFKLFVAILLFLSLNGHHYLIMAVIDSYEWIPLQGNFLTKIYSGELSQFLIQSFIKMFYIAFQMAAPLIAALFLADVAFGILAKTAPQFNIFVIGFPVKILIGFLVLGSMMTGFGFLLQHLFEVLFGSIQQLFELLGGSA